MHPTVKARYGSLIHAVVGAGIQSKDPAIFRAIADVIDSVRANGVPDIKEWEFPTDAERGGQFLEAWSCVAENCPQSGGEGSIWIGNQFMKLCHPLPSLDEVWLLGCHRFEWDQKQRWNSGDDLEKIKERLRKYLRDYKLPWRKIRRGESSGPES